MRARSRGVSLIELMVAVTLALVTIIVVMQVLSVYEARKRTTTAANDAEIGASVGLYMLEREARMAGAGLTLPAGFVCAEGVNIAHGGVTVSDGAPRAPLAIVDGGAGPDRLEVLRSDSGFGAAPATLVQNMAGPGDELTVNSNLGLVAGDLALVGGADGAKLCTLMQLSDDPDPQGNGWELSHAFGAATPYNPAAPGAAFADAPAYEVGDVVVNLGRLGLRAYGVICSDAGVPAADNSCDLASWDAIAGPDDPALAQVDSLTPQVVNLQAQYGVAPANSQTVNEWVDATGPTWAAPSAANLARIKAVRVAIVTRGNLEREAVSPAELVLWDDPDEVDADGNVVDGKATMQLGDEERRYRYTVLRTVIPLINVIWAGV
jgi:type IV pilus assembly protein PilW